MREKTINNNHGGGLIVAAHKSGKGCKATPKLLVHHVKVRKIDCKLKFSRSGHLRRLIQRSHDSKSNCKKTTTTKRQKATF